MLLRQAFGAILVLAGLCTCAAAPDLIVKVGGGALAVVGLYVAVQATIVRCPMCQGALYRWPQLCPYCRTELRWEKKTAVFTAREFANRKEQRVVKQTRQKAASPDVD